MQALLDDKKTYETVTKNPFGRVERELNSKLLSLKNEGKLDDKTYRKLQSSDGLPPTIRGSVKYHKEGYPLRPIVNCIGSALYNTSKYLTEILSPIQNMNNNSVLNSTQFAREISSMKIDDDETMVSFDVVSLFTAIPVQKTCHYIRTKLEQDDTLTLRTNLTIDDIISLLDFTLSNNYFIYNDVTYKQIHGCAMGSPVSPVVANICMEVIENTAIETTQTKPKTWKRFVDDSFSIIKKTAITSFLNSLNNIDPNISFTIELEQDNKISFLDTLIIRHGKNLKIDVFRKPTHTDRYLDFNSHHDIKHKISAARTLIHRALTLPSTHASKQDELNHITTTLKCNGYPDKIIKQILRDSTLNTIMPSPEELVGQFFKRFDDIDKPSGYVTLPYISGITDALRRILQKQNIRVATKPLKTLQRMFPSPKHQIPPEQRTNVVYNIPCSDCPWSYVGETGRSFETRKKEHIRSVKNCKKRLKHS